MKKKPIEVIFENIHKQRIKKAQEHEIKKKHRFKLLQIRSKELGEPIPTELLVVNELDISVGSEFIKKHQKWLN